MAITVVGIVFGTFSAGDTDPYGYVSQADLIAKGTLRVDQTFAREMPWPEPEVSFVPPGYTLGADKRFVVPMYSAGLPLLMAIAQRLTGDRDAVFYVVPLLSALAIGATFALGRRVHDPITGVAAALLLATSPVFLNQVPQPVSDVPATAWWTLALVLALQPGVISAAAAGAAAAMSIWTRVNLAPLAVVLGLYFIWTVFRAEDASRKAAMLRLTAFVIGALPACILLGVINQHLHGSPFLSGYGSAAAYFKLEYLAPNLDRYPRWLLEAQTPFVGLALLAPIFVRTRTEDLDRPAAEHITVLMASVGVLAVMYLFYGVFGREEWGYLRLLLPAFPALLVLSVGVLHQLLRRVPARARAIVIVATALVLSAWQVNEARQRGAFATQIVERRYVDVGRHIATAAPENAVVIAGLHSGSIRYYSGRLTLNFGRLTYRALDRAIDGLAARGLRPFIVLEEGEEEHFTRRFSEASAVAALDWPPRFETQAGVRVRIWDPADRARFLAGEPIAPQPIASTIQ